MPQWLQTSVSSYKVGRRTAADPLVINGVLHGGPLEMAENQWVGVISARNQWSLLTPTFNDRLGGPT